MKFKIPVINILFGSVPKIAKRFHPFPWSNVLIYVKECSYGQCHFLREFEVLQYYSIFIRVRLLLVICRVPLFEYSQIHSEYSRQFLLLGING